MVVRYTLQLKKEKKTPKKKCLTKRLKTNVSNKEKANKSNHTKYGNKQVTKCPNNLKLGQFNKGDSKFETHESSIAHLANSN